MNMTHCTIEVSCYRQTE